MEVPRIGRSFLNYSGGLFLKSMQKYFEGLEYRAMQSKTLKYERALAGNLKDITLLYYPCEWNYKRIKVFAEASYDLIEGWGRITRERRSKIVSKILKSGLTFLPVTKKAEEDIVRIKEKWDF